MACHPQLTLFCSKKHSEKRHHSPANSDIVFWNTFCISPSLEPTFPHTQFCVRFRELFFLLGMTPPHLSSSGTSLPQLQCPLSKHVLSVSFQWTLDTSNSPCPKGNQPASLRNLFPFLAYLLLYKIFFPKSSSLTLDVILKFILKHKRTGMIYYVLFF